MTANRVFSCYTNNVVLSSIFNSLTKNPRQDHENEQKGMLKIASVSFIINFNVQQ